MATEKELLDLTEIISTAIEIHGSEEEFFRRSARASTNEVAKALLLEIADDVGGYREKLEARRRSLAEQLASLQKTKREVAGKPHKST
jgi:hypothetical protein